jgi:hypothetical protein
MAIANSWFLKLQRAREHIYSFQKDSAAWIATKPYGIVDERDPDPPLQTLGIDAQARRYRIDRVTDVPLELSVIIGDCLFNLRSALDHLAFALAQKHTGAMSNNQIVGSGFPIFGRKPDAKDWAKKVGCMAPGASSIIEKLQPYHRGNDFAQDALWKIHRLNIIDKHRALTLCGAEPLRGSGRGFGIHADGFTNWKETLQYSQTLGRFSFEKNAIWMRWAPHAIDPSQEVRVEADLPVEIVFDKSGPAPLEPVLISLHALCDYVDDPVIALLTPFL